VVSLFFII